MNVRKSKINSKNKEFCCNIYKILLFKFKYTIYYDQDAL